MLPAHSLASRNRGIPAEEGDDENVTHSGLELHAQLHDAPHPSSPKPFASSGQAVADGTGGNERHARERVTQSDWNEHRETIAYLYRDLMQPLHRVKETMERDYGFYATERMYKHRFKQWHMFKYAKQRGGLGQSAHGQDGKAPQSPPSSAHRPSDGCPPTIPTPLVQPDSLRNLTICMSHLHSFLLATCGNTKRRLRRVDPSPEMALDRLSWFFSVNHAVLHIHQGRLAAGFRLLDGALDQFRHSIASHDTGFPLRLVACLSLFADHGLPGLAAIFLQYAHHALCLVLSPAHPFSIIVSHLRAMVSKDGVMDRAWDLVARYSDLLWQWSDPHPTTAHPSEPIPMLTELAWDLSRGVDRDFVMPLAERSQALGWASSHFSVGMAAAQIQLTQRIYGAARRVVEDLLPRLNPATEPLDLALAYRKRWQISRAEAQHAQSYADARTYVDFCRHSLGPDHYMTVRAADDYANYLIADRIAQPRDAGPRRRPNPGGVTPPFEVQDKVPGDIAGVLSLT